MNASASTLHDHRANPAAWIAQRRLSGVQWLNGKVSLYRQE
jgi:hypothetical protein